MISLFVCLVSDHSCSRTDARLKLSMKKGSAYPHVEGVLGDALARNELGETHFGQALTEVGEGLANISEAKDELVREYIIIFLEHATVCTTFTVFVSPCRM